MRKSKIKIQNRLGLHARACSQLTQVASAYESEAWLLHKGLRANAESIMGLMLLAAGQGAVVVLEVDGSDEAEAEAAIHDLVEGYFGEDD